MLTATDQDRLTMLNALIAGIERRSEVVSVAEAAKSIEDAVESISSLLSIARPQAVAVLDVQIRRFIPSELERLRIERAHLLSEA